MSTEVIRKGGCWRELQTVPIGLNPVFLITEFSKCQCQKCLRHFESSPLAHAIVHYTRAFEMLVDNLQPIMSETWPIWRARWDTIKATLSMAR